QVAPAGTRRGRDQLDLAGLELGRIDGGEVIEEFLGEAVVERLEIVEAQGMFGSSDGHRPTVARQLGQMAASRRPHYSGMLPCLRGGLSCRLLRSRSKLSMSTLRV